MIATDKLQSHKQAIEFESLLNDDRAIEHDSLLTEYIIHKTLSNRSSTENLPSTINRVADGLLQNAGQQDSDNLRRTYLSTICKAAVTHMDTIELFAALEPTFEVPNPLNREHGGSDHFAIAAICLNIGPVTDVYVSTHPASRPSSFYFGLALPVAVSHGKLLVTEKLLTHSTMAIEDSVLVRYAARAGHDQLVHLLMSSQNIQWSPYAITGASQGGHMALFTALLENKEKLEENLISVADDMQRAS